MRAIPENHSEQAAQPTPIDRLRLLEDPSDSEFPADVEMTIRIVVERGIMTREEAEAFARDFT